VCEIEEQERVKAKKDAGFEKLTKIEHSLLSQKRKSQSIMGAFLVRKTKSTNIPEKSVMIYSPPEEAVLQAPSSISPITNKPKTCEGIVPKYSEQQFQLNMAAFSMNAAVSSDSKYQCGFFDVITPYFQSNVPVQTVSAEVDEHKEKTTQR
jgi:hypothetical protein